MARLATVQVRACHRCAAIGARQLQLACAGLKCGCFDLHMLHHSAASFSHESLPKLLPLMRANTHMVLLKPGGLSNHPITNTS
jgi:hypothetical protein